MKFNKKQILAMIHLAGGNPVERAMKEIKLLKEKGVDGVIIENYHGDVNDVMDTLVELNKDRPKKFLIGVNVLPNEVKDAYVLANLFKLDFIQLDYVAGTYNRGVSLDVEEYDKNRAASPKIKILGGVHPKYYTPKTDLKTDLEEAMTRCDAIVVTGEGTGKETPLDKINKFREIIGVFPLIIGAGLDTSNVGEQLSIGDGGIVGSSLKPYGRTQEMISAELVEEFMVEVNKLK